MSGPIPELRLPVLAAPMSGGPGTPELAIAAARAGSLGFVAGGYKSPQAMAEQMEALRAAGVSFGVNLFAPNPLAVDSQAYERYAEAIRDDLELYEAHAPRDPISDDDSWHEKVDLLLADPPELVTFTFGIPPSDTITALRRAGTVTVQTVTTTDEALAAGAAGVDALAVQAPGAGGHSATLRPRRRIEARPLAEVVAEIASETELPVLAAGGVADARDVQAAIEAGAAAVLVGTALMLADEAGTTQTHRDALASGDRETILTRAFTGRPARGLRNDFIDRHEAEAPFGYPAIHHLTTTMRRAAAAAGDPERVHLWAGTGYRSARPGSAESILKDLARTL
jgi:NAD(P)H-dependent flavin oxidoreductase YrpB (nitropropane dioxygenase family)